MKHERLALGLVLEDYSTELGTNSTFGKQTDFQVAGYYELLKHYDASPSFSQCQEDCKLSSKF